MNRIKPLTQWAISGGHYKGKESPFLTYGAFSRRAEALREMAEMFIEDDRKTGLRKARKNGYRVIKVNVTAVR